jgi:hypothetical protein
VELPFTPEQFFEIFAEYNRQFWLVVVFWWLATVGVLVLVWRRPGQHSTFLSYFLGALWLWNAAAYHTYLFTRINPAAWLFSALFAVQGVAFVWVGARRGVSYLTDSGARQMIGLVLVAYSLAYPFLTMVIGHTYPAVPTFGLPCPTVILTIGLLLTVSGGIPLSLAVIPIAWGFVGGSAAVLLTVFTDYVLFAAGLLLLVTLVAQQLRQRRVAHWGSPAT